MAAVITFFLFIVITQIWISITGQRILSLKCQDSLNIHPKGVYPFIWLLT